MKRKYNKQKYGSCSSCAFWDCIEQHKEDSDGKCRRYPPKLDQNYYKVDEDSITEVSSWWVFPLTYCDDWCGEHKSTIGQPITM